MWGVRMQFSKANSGKLGGGGLDLENVDGGGGNLVGLQSGNQGVGVDHGAAGGVD